MKKIISLLLTFALVFQLALPAMAAEGDNNQFTMKVDKTSVEVGDKVYITVGCDSAFTNLSLMAVFVEYDDTVFEATQTLYKAEDNANKSWDFNVQKVGESGYTTPTVQASILDFNAGLNLSAGDYLTMEFTAIKASEGAKFTFTYPEVGNDDYDIVEYALKCPEDITVTVTDPSTSGGDEGGELVIPDGLNIARITSVTKFTKGDDMEFSLWAGTESAPSYVATVPQGTETVTITFTKDSHCEPYNNYTTGDLTLSGFKVVSGSTSASGSEDLATKEDDGLYSITLDVADMIESGTYYGAYGPNYEKLYLLGFEYGGESTDTPHTCVFDKEVASEDYLATAATCKAQATYYKSCSCGEKGEETFVSGDLGDHSYDESGICSVCGFQSLEKWSCVPGIFGATADQNLAIGAGLNTAITMTEVSGKLEFKTFKATITYDPAVLDLTNYIDVTRNQQIFLGAVSDDGNGTITVESTNFGFYVAENKGLCNLMWKTIGLGDASIKLTSLTIDGKAIISEPVVLKETVGYPVTLPTGDGFTVTGDAYAPVNGEYTFTVTVDEDYDATNMVVSNNGTALTANEDGTYTISNVSAAPAITVEGVTEAAAAMCGDELYWSYADGTLTITGTGAMYTYKEAEIPWAEHLAEITAISLPEGMTNISKFAFKNCTALTSVVIPDTVETIASDAFRGCTSLASVTLGSSVKTIDSYAFCDACLTNVVLPDSVVTIGGNVFANNTELKSVTFGTQVTSIGSDAFNGCTSLTSIAIPNGVTQISANIFKGCTALTSVTIPDTVTVIQGNAFKNCTSLASITIPGSVTKIGDGAFGGSGLKSIVIPDSVQIMTGGKMNSAFKGCTALESVTLGSGITELTSNMFADCTALKSITIPATVKSIGTKAFAGCTALTEIRFEGSAPTFKSDAFTNVTATAYYKASNDGWTETVMQNYGGTITWMTEQAPVDPDQPVTPIIPAESIGITGNGVTSTGTSTYSLTLTKGASSTMTAKVYPEDATNQNVVWSSDKEEVATVTKDGQITAVGAGTATITATIAEEETLSRAANVVSTIAVTVNDLPEGAGYTVTMGKDQSVTAGETVAIGVTVGHTDGTTGYNAFDMTFTYDASALTLKTTSLEGMTVTATEGKVNVKGYGADRAVDSIPFTLEFTAVKTGTSDITLTSAKVDNGAHAIDNNAPEATAIDDTTVITVTGYPVSLPDGFTGDKVAEPNKDYTFTKPDDNNDYTITVKVNGEEVDVTDNGDGSYTIPADKVTGPIEITETHVGKTFSVTLGEDMTGEATAQYGVDYTATLNKVNGYDYNVTITIGGKEYTGYTVDGDTYTIPGADITGEIIFSSGKTQQGGGEQPGTSHTVTFEGSGAGAAEGNAKTVAHGADYTFTLTKEKGYTYEVSAKTASGTALGVKTNENGSYTIENVTENITINIDRALDITVEVSEYVTLNEKAMFLVLVTGEHEEGKCFTYNGSAMVYSEVYKAYAYLTVESGEYSADTAKKCIALTDGENKTVASANFDVNQTGLVDINDAQLVYDIYNGKYEDVSTLGLEKLLNADTEVDKTVNVQDAIAVVANIK